MKNFIYTATLTLAVSLPASLISASVPSAAYAAEQACEFTAGSATTGGAIQAQLDAIARCNSGRTQSTTLETSPDKPKTMPSTGTTTNIQQSNSQANDFYPAYCYPYATLQPEEFGFREFIERCKYGN